MPRNKEIKKVLVIGSGPIVIGQAAEFDYAGTQACRSLKEEGLEVVLLNSNPATIMTDKDIADKVYIEPLTVEVVEQLIMKEKPDSVLPTLGGQAALNLAMELEERGFFKEHNVRLIGTTAQTIKKAEDRLEFKSTMEKIGEPCAASLVVESVEDGIEFAEKIGYPVVLRPAYTLGGSGGGIAHDRRQLVEILENGLRLSRVGQVLVERCIAGWKEIEYEVMRDAAGNCITVCNMENIDPVGVHTGDSIVVAPSQTLGDKEYQMLRTSALNIISELNITGGCNVQYALNPESFEYCVIEVNPRVSRSSALASKATGYPIAKVAAKIALGYTLDEIKNAVTKKRYASFEPMLDYCVVKIPRLPFDKFISAKRTLTTQMKATGEVMSICDNFEGALMKAIRSLEQHVDSLMSYDFSHLSREELMNALDVVDDQRIWKIAEAVRRGIPYTEIHKITKIDIWFIDKIANLVEMEQSLRACAPRVASGRGGIEKELLKEYQNFEVYLDSPAQIHVYPAEVTVEESRQINRLFQYSAMSKKPLIEDNFSFAGIRQYIPGDAMNALNYKQTARRGELMVNDREYLAGRKLLVYVNFQPNEKKHFPPEQFHELIEKELSYASYLLGESIRNGYVCSFAANSKMMHGGVAPRYAFASGEEYYQELLCQMAEMTDLYAVSMLSVMKQDIEERLGNTEIFLFTPYYDTTLAGAVEDLERNGNVVTVVDVSEE